MSVKKALLATFALVCLTVRAWDVEHDVVAMLTGEALPPEIRAFFTFDDFGILMANCHYPDWIPWPLPDGSHRSHTLDEMAEIIGAEDAALLRERGIAVSGDFHWPRARADLMTMLARAFGRGDHAAAAFYMSLLTHVVSDISALNHPPIMQFLLCSSFQGVEYPKRRVEEGAKNLFGFSSDGRVAHLARKRVRSHEQTPFKGEWQSALVAFAADEVWQGAFAAEKEGLIAFASEEESIGALADLVAMQIHVLVDAITAAWRNRSPNAEFPDAKFESEFTAESRRLADRTDPARQAVFAEIFDTSRNPRNPLGHVTIVCEPYAYLSCNALSYVGRMISASAGRTLRDAGYAVYGISLSDVVRKGLPIPRENIYVLVSLGPGMVSDAAAAAIASYRRSGGNLIAFGGEDPMDVTGLREMLVKCADADVPVAPRWSVRDKDVWRKMSISYGGRTYPFTRNPDIAGYAKPYAPCVFRDDADVVPLVFLDNGRGRHVSGARKGNVTWLPEYALMPFVLSDSTSLNWRSMRLDEPGRTILLGVMKGNAHEACSRKVPNIVNFVRGCEPRTDANSERLDEPLRHCTFVNCLSLSCRDDGDSEITHCSFEGCDTAICALVSLNTVVEGNVIRGFRTVGLELRQSDLTKVVGNVFENGPAAAQFSLSRDCRMIGNLYSDCKPYRLTSEGKSKTVVEPCVINE